MKELSNPNKSPLINQSVIPDTKKNKLLTLVKMQLKEKLKWGGGNIKTTLVKLVFFVVFFIAVSFAANFVFQLGVSLSILSLNAHYTPPNFMIFIFTIMQVMSIVTATVSLTKSLYFSQDNKILLTLPARPNDIFLSKLIVYYILELKKSFLYIVPVFIGYGMYNKMPLEFYPLLIVSFFIISLFIVFFASLLSVPYMYVLNFIKKSRYVQMVLYALCLAFFVWVVMSIAASVPSEFHFVAKIGDYFYTLERFLKQFADGAIGFNYVTKMLIGQKTFIPYSFKMLPLSSIITFVVLVVAIVAMLAIVWFAIRGLFFNMASKAMESGNKSKLTNKSNYVLNKFYSLTKKEWLLNFRLPATFFHNFVFLFCLPFMLFLLNTVFAAMDLRPYGITLATSFNIMIILVIILPNNTYAASVFSREGAAVALQKNKPLTPREILISKLTINYALSIISLLVTVLLIWSLGMLNVVGLIGLFFSVVLIYTAHLLWSADIDMANPQVEMYKQDTPPGLNLNEVKSAVLAFLIAGAYFAISFLFIPEGKDIAFIKLIVISALVLAIRLVINHVRLKAYNYQM